MRGCRLPSGTDREREELLYENDHNKVCGVPGSSLLGGEFSVEGFF